MHVVHIINALCVGGAETLVRNMVSLDSAAREPVEYTVVALMKGPNSLSLPAGVGFVQFDLGASPVRSLWRLYRVIRRCQPDVIHGHFVIGSFLSLLLGRLLSIPVVVTEHGLTNLTERPAWLVGFYSRILQGCAVVIAVSDVSRDYIIERLPALAPKVALIPNGIDVESFLRLRDARAREVPPSKSFPSEARVVGFVGRLSEEKRIHLLISACARLMPEDPRICLLVVGDGSARRGLEELAARLLPGGRYAFTGAVQDTRPYLARMSVFVLTSETESFGLALLEALVAGLPCVALETAALRQFEAPGLDLTLLPQSAPGALADTIAAILRDPARGVPGPLPPESAARYDVRAMNARHAFLYAKLCALRA